MTKILGKGGFGCVRQEFDNNGLAIARKTLELTQYEEDNLELIRRFRREVEYQSKFNHQNIVTVLNSDLEAIPPYFDMPLAVCCLGQEAYYGFNYDFAVKIKAFFDVLSGVGFIHQYGHAHRDIKPANILRYHDPYGGYYYAVSDFGLIAPSSRDETSNITSTNVGMGTQNYMAPECYLNAKNATTLSDIYSLGVLLLWLFGEQSEFGFPFEERHSKCIFGDIIQKCTKREMGERYQSVIEIESEMQAVLAKLPKGSAL